MNIWNALKIIPYGETASYKKQADILGISKAIRAVGKANGGYVAVSGENNFY